MNGWLTVPLGEVFEVQLGKMLDKKKNQGDPMPYLGNRNVQWDHCNVEDLALMRFTEADREKYELREGDLLVCEGGEVGRTAVWRGEIEPCFYQKAVHRLRARAEIEPRFAFYFMRWSAETGAFRQLTTSTSIAHLTKEKLETVDFPLPPLPEQRRIAAILDETDALRRKRREALGLLDELLRSAFLEMFGDPVTNPRGWPVEPMSRLVSDGFRNGLSPSSRGTVEGMVLTLSAVTGGAFDPTQVKQAVFDREPDDSQLARDGAFLICRGNGNIGLVGQGQVARGAAPGTAFPDTVIACRPLPDLLTTSYLAAVWRTRVVRSQVEAGARTTNGTHKVNQQVLAAVRIPVPAATAQRRFDAFAVEVEGEKARVQQAVAAAEDLFATLLHRAFAGDLRSYHAT